MFEREYRDLAHVGRWAIVRTIQKQDVAQHSYYVALYVTHILFKLELDPRFTLPCIYRALEHDRAESFTGDIPGPIKDGLLADNNYEKNMDHERFETDDWSGANELELAVVKVADLMDQYAFWMEEGVLGNGRAGQLLADISSRLDAAGDRLGLLVNAHKKGAETIYIKDRILAEFYSQCRRPKILPRGVEPRDLVIK